MATRGGILDAVASRLPLEEDDFAMTSMEKDRVRMKEVVKNVIASEFGVSSRTDQIALAMNIKGGYVKDKKTLQDLKRKIELENTLKLDEEDFKTQLTGQTYYVNTDKAKVRVVSPDELKIIDSKDRPLADNDGYLTQRREIPFVPGLWSCVVVPLPDLDFWKKELPKKSGMTPCWELVSITDYGSKANEHAQVDCSVLVIGPQKLALADRVHARTQQEYMYESVKKGVPVHKLDFKPNVLIWDAMKSDQYKNVIYDPVKDTGFNVYKPAVGVYYRELIKIKPKFGEQLNNEGLTTLITSKGNSFTTVDNDLGRGLQLPFGYMCVWTAKYSESERFPKPQVEFRDMDFQFVCSYREEVKIDVDDALKMWSDEIYAENAPRMESTTWMGPNFVQPSHLRKHIDLINPINVVHREDETAKTMHVPGHDEVIDDTRSEYSTESRLDFTIRTRAYNPIEEHRTDLISHHPVIAPVASESGDVNIFDALPNDVNEEFLLRVPREVEKMDSYVVGAHAFDDSSIPREWQSLPGWINSHKLAFKAFYERQTGQHVSKGIFMADPCDIMDTTNFDQVFVRLTECIRQQLQFVHEEFNIVERLVPSKFYNKADTLMQSRVEGEKIVLHERCKNFVMSRLCQAEHLLTYASEGVDGTRFNNTIEVSVDGKDIHVFPQCSLLLRGGFGNCDLGNTFEGIVRDLSVWIEFHAHFIATKVITLPKYHDLIKNQWEGAGVVEDYDDLHPLKGSPTEDLFQSKTLGELDKVLSMSAVLTAACNLAILNGYLKHYGVGDESLRLHAKPYEAISECKAQMKYFCIYFRYLYNHELFSVYGDSIASDHPYPKDDGMHNKDYVYWAGGYLLTPDTFTVIDDQTKEPGTVGKEDDIIPKGNGTQCNYFKGVELLFPRYRHPLTKTDVGYQLIMIDDVFHGHSTMLHVINTECNLVYERGLTKVFTKDVASTTELTDFTLASVYSKAANFLTDQSGEGVGALHAYLADRIEAIGESVVIIPTSFMYRSKEYPDDEKYLFDFGSYVRTSNISWTNGPDRIPTNKLSEFYTLKSTINHTINDETFKLPAVNDHIMPVCCSPFNWFFGEPIRTAHIDFPVFPRFTKVTLMNNIFKRDYLVPKPIDGANAADVVTKIREVLDFGVIKDETVSKEVRMAGWNVPREPLRLWMNPDAETVDKTSTVNMVGAVVPITNHVRRADLNHTADFNALFPCPWFYNTVVQYWVESVKFEYNKK